MDKQTQGTHIDEDDDLDKLMDEGAKDLDKKIPVTAQQVPKMQAQGTTSQMADDMGLGGDFDFSKLGLDEKSMQDAMKMFEQSMGGQEGGSGADMNPFMNVCKQMFDDLEGKGTGNPLSGAGGDSEEDANFMKLLSGLTKDMMQGDQSQQEGAMDKILGEFSNFMKDSEGNEEMKSALDSVVQEIISKDTLYEPMKHLKDEFPAWLEKNWEKLSHEDLERYNKQVDKIGEICKMYETSQGQDNQLIFEHLSQLQELGSPPDDLMKLISEKQLGGGAGNPFADLASKMK